MCLYFIERPYITLGICFVWLTTVIAAPPERALTEDEQIAKLAKLFDIDIETKPGDGSVSGVRIRRNNYAQGAFEGDDLSLPELNIRQINDKTVQVNGIRLRRNDLSDLSDVELERDLQQAEDQLEGESVDERTRRSGGELLGFLGAKISQKLSALAGASSGHNSEPDHSYGPPVNTYDQKSFDFWSFKKAILHTLLQAVKAIKGGVIAIGGQLVKVKGHIISTAGKIVSHKGEAISNFGRQIVSKAVITPPSTSYGTSAVEHVPDTGAGYPAAEYPYPPAAAYGPPAISNSYSPAVASVSNSYGAPSSGYTKRGAANPYQFGVPHELPNGVQAGLLVLKPVASNDHYQSSPYISPRGVPTFGAREPQSAASEIQPIAVKHTSQSRSYFLRY